MMDPNQPGMNQGQPMQNPYMAAPPMVQPQPTYVTPQMFHPSVIQIISHAIGGLYSPQQIYSNPALFPQLVTLAISRYPTLLTYFKGVSNSVGQRRTMPTPLPSRRGRKKKNEDLDEITELSSSETSAGEFTSDEPDFDELPDDYVPENTVDKREVLRHRERKNYSEESLYNDEIPEDEETEERLERIFMKRDGANGTEFLVKLTENSTGIAQWVPRSVLMNITGADSQISRFNENPILYNTVEDMHPIGYKDGSLLWTAELADSPVFFWEKATPEQIREFLSTRDCIKTGFVNYSNMPPITGETKDKDVNLKGYQIEGVNWLLKCLKEGHGSILADEMGLGKTAQLLYMLDHLNKYSGCHGPFLIIVRTNTFKQWVTEIERWTTSLTFVPYNQSPTHRKIIRDYVFPGLDTNGEVVPGALSFHILLLSYDVFLKDHLFFKNIRWEMIVLDEGHRIKNSNGVKNNAIRDQQAQHRIILTGTPIQNSLEELWALLQFVSPKIFEETPDFVSEEIENLSPERVEEISEIIKPHYLRRTMTEVNQTLAPKEESVAFLQLTEDQRDLIRLIKLHSSWRFKGVQTSEFVSDSMSEWNLILKACLHPFLIEGGETYYKQKYIIPRDQLIESLSAKFIWLDKAFKALKKEGHRVLLFSQRVSLIELISEFCELRGYESVKLIGSMTEIEKNEAIESFQADDSDVFVFLISTRAGNEGLNLTKADVTIIFDPDWNPQNDLQAQARNHRLGQTKPVQIIRLISYKTYEHEMFVRSQKKLSLWMTLLGQKIDLHDMPQVPEPPVIDYTEEYDLPFKELLKTTTTLVENYTLELLPSFTDYHCEEETTDEKEFLEKFPVKLEDSGKRRKIRTREHDVDFTHEEVNKLYRLFREYGYAKYVEIHEQCPDHSIEQVQRFCLTLVILLFRAIAPHYITTFPLLFHKITKDCVDFTYKFVLNSKKKKWLDVFDADHPYVTEANALKSKRDDIYDDAYDFLCALEIRLAADAYFSRQTPDDFPYDDLAPVSSKEDKSWVTVLSTNGFFDPQDERIQAIYQVFKTYIIQNDQTSDAACFIWWSPTEISAVQSAIRNFSLADLPPKELQEKVSILSKTPNDLKRFVDRFIELLDDEQGNSFDIPESMSHFNRAPSKVQKSRRGHWTTVRKSTSYELYDAMQVIEALDTKIMVMPEEDGFGWTSNVTKRYLQHVKRFGLSFSVQILIDERFEFYGLLPKSAVNYFTGKNETPGKHKGIPKFLFDQQDFYDFIRDIPPVRSSGDQISLTYPRVKHLVIKSDDVKSEQIHKKTEKKMMGRLLFELGNQEEELENTSVDDTPSGMD